MSGLGEFGKALGKAVVVGGGAIAGTKIGSAIYDQYGAGLNDRYKEFNEQSLKDQGFEKNAPTHIAYPRDLDNFDTKQNIVHFCIMERRGFRNIHNIYLPQPGNFTISDSAQYDEIERSAMANLAMGGGALADKAINALMNPGSFNAKNMFNTESLSSLAADAAVVNTLVTGGLPLIGSISGELAYAAGATQDRGQRTRYTNNTIREFSFEFTMQAKNKQETNDIKNIIDMFRKFSYPLKGSNNLALSYPPEVIVTFRHSLDGKMVPNPYMPALLPAFLKGISTDYNPNTIATHTDGSPQAYKISLNFVEVKRLIRDELEGLEQSRIQQREHELFYATTTEVADALTDLNGSNPGLLSGEGSGQDEGS